MRKKVWVMIVAVLMMTILIETIFIVKYIYKEQEVEYTKCGSKKESENQN